MNQFVTMKRAAFIALGLLWGGQEGACASLQEAQKQDIKISVIQEHLLTVEKHEDSDANKTVNPFATYVSAGGSSETNEERNKRRQCLSDKIKIITPFIGAECLLLKSSLETLSPLQLGSGLVGGWLLADLISGLVHFTFDNLDWKNPMWPQSMKEMGVIFQWHHDYPHETSKCTFWGLSREPYIFGLVGFTLAGILSFYDYNMSAYLLSTTSFLAAQSHYVHGITHGKHHGNRLVKFLQRYRLIDSIKYHGIHHNDPEHATNYCLFNGQMNRVLDPVISVGRFFYRVIKNWYGRKTEPSQEKQSLS